MIAASWQRYIMMGDRDIDAADFEAAMAAADSRECCEDLDLGDPWDDEFDPLDDDPE